MAFAEHGTGIPYDILADASLAAQRLLPAASTFQRPSDVAAFLAAIMRPPREAGLGRGLGSGLAVGLMTLPVLPLEEKGGGR